jgi:hypothetical protein
MVQPSKPIVRPAALKLETQGKETTNIEEGFETF